MKYFLLIFLLLTLPFVSAVLDYKQTNEGLNIATLFSQDSYFGDNEASISIFNDSGNKVIKLEDGNNGVFTIRNISHSDSTYVLSFQIKFSATWNLAGNLDFLMLNSETSSPADGNSLQNIYCNTNDLTGWDGGLIKTGGCGLNEWINVSFAFDDGTELIDISFNNTEVISDRDYFTNNISFGSFSLRGSSNYFNASEYILIDNVCVADTLAECFDAPPSNSAPSSCTIVGGADVSFHTPLLRNVNVTSVDPDGDQINKSYYVDGNLKDSSGFVNNGTYQILNYTFPFEPSPDLSVPFYVECCDNNSQCLNSSSYIYNLTDSSPSVALNSPAHTLTFSNDTTDVLLNYTYSDSDNDLGLVYLYYECSDATPDVLVQTNTSVSDGTDLFYNATGLIPDTSCYWIVKTNNTYTTSLQNTITSVFYINATPGINYTCFRCDGSGSVENYTNETICDGVNWKSVNDLSCNILCYDCNYVSGLINETFNASVGVVNASCGVGYETPEPSCNPLVCYDCTYSYVIVNATHYGVCGGGYSFIEPSCSIPEYSDNFWDSVNPVDAFALVLFFVLVVTLLALGWYKKNG